MTSGIIRLGPAAVAVASLTLLAACAAGSDQSTSTTTSATATSSDPPATTVTSPESNSLPGSGSGFMTPQVHISSSSSSRVVGGVSSGKVVVTVNGRTCQLDVPDAVSVRTVTENSQAYVEITDKNGRTRRVDCSS